MQAKEFAFSSDSIEGILVVDKASARVYIKIKVVGTMTSSIGIKIANGEFYPVLEEGSTVRKRLVLTTVHDGQRSVQIDLYRSESRSMIDASYIGSLVVENIADKPKGEPSIELIIGSGGGDELSAEAADLDDPAAESRQSLSVALRAMDDGETYDVPDFELEGEEEPVPPAGLYEETEEPDPEPKRGRHLMVPIALAVVLGLLVGIAAVWFLAFGGGKPLSGVPEEPAKPQIMQAAPAAATPATTAKAAEPVRPASEPPKPTAPAVSKEEAAARRARPAAPVKSYKVPKTIPKEGFRYRIRWGDTLWDISEAFYRNPWLYPRIARFNKIRNPDRILAGSYIRIPPKN